MVTAAEASAAAFQIQDLPFAASLGQWIWGHAPNPDIISPDICLGGLQQSHNMSNDCWMQVLVKGMGVSMILGACLNKAPTLANIVASQSTAGLPKSSIYGETLIMLNATLYGYLQGFPFTAYGENAAIALQCAMIMWLMWHYNSQKEKGNHQDEENEYNHEQQDMEEAALSAPRSNNNNTLVMIKPNLTAKSTITITTQHQEQIIVSCLAIFYVFSVTHYVPPSHHYLLMSSVMPIMIYARGCQIREAYRLQHTGAQSIATTTISLGGNLGRILTTIKEVGLDTAALSWYVMSALLNGIMLVQYGLYRKNTSSFFLKENGTARGAERRLKKR